MVIVALDEVAVNVYQTLYALPVPHVGAGVADGALCKLPETTEQVVEGVSEVAEVHWEYSFWVKLTKTMKAANGRTKTLVLMNRI